MRLTNKEIEDSLNDDYTCNADLDPVSETGVWSVGWNDNKKQAYVESSDFTHDVIMWISGDFGSKTRALTYANIIAERLNSFNPVLNQRL